MHITLHPGPHKTATSMIQASLKETFGEVATNGVANARSFTPGLFKAVRWSFVSLCRNPNRKNIREATAALSNLISDAEEQGVNHLIISEENLLGHPPSFYIMKSGQAKFYKHNEIAAELISDLVKTHDANVVFTTRKQESLFLSHYMDGLRWLRFDISIDEFWELLKQQGVEELRFDALMQPWSKAFGTENVEHISYELLVSNPDGFMREVERTFMLPAGALLLAENKVNASFPGYKAVLARRLYLDVKAGKITPKEARRTLLKAQPIDGDEAIAMPCFSERSLSQIRAGFADDITYKEYSA